MLRADGLAAPVERVVAGRLALALRGEAVGELLAVVGEDLLDLERAGLGEPFEEAAGALGGLVGEDLKVDPAAWRGRWRRTGRIWRTRRAFAAAP